MAQTWISNFIQFTKAEIAKWLCVGNATMENSHVLF